MTDGVLAPVAALAAKYGVAVVIVAHRRKSGGGGGADESTLGSRAFTGLARAVWHVVRDTTDPARRLLLPGKNNLAVEGSGFAFWLVGQPVAAVEWESEPVTMSADDVIGAESGERERHKPGPEPAARTAAVSWLRETLAPFGSLPVGRPESPADGTIRRLAKAAGIA